MEENSQNPAAPTGQCPSPTSSPKKGGLLTKLLIGGGLVAVVIVVLIVNQAGYFGGCINCVDLTAKEDALGLDNTESEADKKAADEDIFVLDQEQEEEKDNNVPVVATDEKPPDENVVMNKYVDEVESPVVDLNLINEEAPLEANTESAPEVLTDILISKPIKFLGHRNKDRYITTDGVEMLFGPKNVWEDSPIQTVAYIQLLFDGNTSNYQIREVYFNH